MELATATAPPATNRRVLVVAALRVAGEDVNGSLTGKLEIWELAKKSNSDWAGDFVLREFHAAVLDSGSVQMPILHEDLGRWIASRIPPSPSEHNNRVRAGEIA